MKLILDVIDIWLPDFKYGNDECARRLSGVNNYFKIVTRNLLLTKEDDIIIRHLVLPNHLECCTYPILEWLARNLKDKLVNIMGQYRPEHIVARLPHTFPDIARRPYLSEMERAMSYAKSLGLVYEPVS
jgi:putative pyruvate formate lyase activating enzyme